MDIVDKDSETTANSEHMLIASLCLQRYNILFSLSSNFFLNLMDLMMHFGYTQSKLLILVASPELYFMVHCISK